MGSSQSSQSRSRSRSGSRTRRNATEHSWKEDAPNKKERVVMLKKCGRKCFLGPGTSFPVCTCGTCDVNPRGVQSAYSRAREWASITARKKHNYANAKTHRGYVEVANRAKRLLKHMKHSSSGSSRSRPTRRR
jgi:hypothetical protein